MTNEEIFKVAMQQSAYDTNCSADDFLKSGNVISDFYLGDKARKYLEEPITCNLASYGNNIVASIKTGYRDIIVQYIGKFDFYHCFETPNMLWLNEKLAEYNQKICFMAQYYLPDINELRRLSCDYSLKILKAEDFSELYLPQWSNALCEKRKELDILGVGAYDNGQLIGLAACSADCEDMWQIGIDVLPQYRKQGIAASLVSNLSMEILDKGKVPFYCCAWSNVRSARTAVKCGFVPAWVELTVKPAGIVDEMNK